MAKPAVNLQSRNLFWCRVVAVVLATLLVKSAHADTCDDYVLGTSDRSEPLQLDIETYLGIMGMKLDCYFTVERIKPAEGTGSFYGETVKADVSLKTVDALIGKLRKDLKRMTIRRSSENRAVVHIIETPLLGIHDYVINTTLDLRYSGSLADLREQLSKRLDKRIGEWAGGTMAFMNEGDRPKVDVNATGLTVQRILTDFLPLSLRSGILWDAQTDLNQKPAYTSVQFATAAQSDSFGSNTIEKSEGSFPFTCGVLAYAFNPATPRQISAATDFMEGRMRTKRTSQVRWAMFFLGKHKVEQAIPLLLKHLNYKYTNCGLIEESYPALKALRQIGDAASRAALETLPKERDEMKLHLLCRLILNVDGFELGQQHIQSSLTKLKTGKQRDAIQAALKKAINDSSTAE